MRSRLAVNLTRNPYFNPEPTTFFVVLKAWLSIGVTFGTIGNYCILFKSPPHKLKIFRFLLFYHTSVRMLFQVCLTTFSTPILMLPYVAIKFHGLFSSLSVPPSIQLQIFITLIVATAAFITPLFYYRMGALLPPGHFLNKKLFRILFYSIDYGACILLPSPLIRLSLQDQLLTKSWIQEKFKVLYEDLWSSEVIALYIRNNNYWLIIGCALINLGIVVSNGISFVCIYVIYDILKTSTSMSCTNKKHHKALLISLTSLMTVQLSTMAIIAPALAGLIAFNSYRADIFNIVIMMAGGMYPLSVSSYCLAYKPYRDFLLCHNKLWPKKAAVKVSSVNSNTPTAA